MSAKELVMYTRTSGCPFVSIAKRVLHEHNISYREVFIDKDDSARQRLLDWVGFLSVPTLLVADPGDVLPVEPPAHLEPGKSPRGIDRGVMITEASAHELLAWLQKHDFVAVTQG